MTKSREQIIEAVIDYCRGWFMQPEIQIQDVYEDIASVTVRTRGVHEYLHLVRRTDGWQIANTIWRQR